MQKQFTFLLIFIFFIVPTISLAKTKQYKQFDAVKVYADQDYVLNDTMEFTLFDLSEIKIVNDSKEIHKGLPTEDNADAETKVLNALNETQSILEKLPSYFYKSLEQEILRQKVPVTLYSDRSPDYAKPLQLYVKVKRVHLKPPYLGKDGRSYVQPFLLRIYGQVTDKKNGEILIKFYDSQESLFVLGSNQAAEGFQDASKGLMGDLTAFLRTKY